MVSFMQENDVFQITEQFVIMPDGVNLYTRVMQPKPLKKCPVVVVRTPYEPAHNGEPHSLESPGHGEFLKHGYAVVVQHCRGTGDSEGICIPYWNERKDGLALLEWIRQQDFYGGEVYLYGGSYLSTVHLSYLADRPHDVKGAVLNIQTDRMYFRNYRYGCSYDFCNVGWWLGMMQRQYPNAVREVPARRPYKDLLARIIGEEVPYYTEHLMNDRYNEFWKSDSRTDAVDNITFPVLFVEGWYDFYLEGMFDMWRRLPERTREQSVFWVGPWGHAVPTVPQENPRFPGSALPEDYAAVWFDSIRANVPYPYAQTGKVNYYAPGENRRYVREFPATAEFRRLYLSADSALVGDSAVPGARTFCADPDNAPACFAKDAFAEAFAPDSQPDVLSFVGKPFQQEQHFFGAVRLHMEVSSDCDDTAFYFRLYLTGPDGESHYLTETIAALRFLHSDYRAGDVVCLELETPPMAFSVPTGHTVRLDLAFCGGAYVPHANVAGHWAEVTETRIAHNTVFCGNSFVELPQKTQE